MATKRYSDYLEISPTFESVVDIDADKRNANLWREYIVGDDMDKLMEFLCESLGNEAPDLRRSFWIHGSYGTGKSYAALFVKHLIEEKPEVIDAYLASSNRLSQYRNRVAKFRKNGDYLVIWKTGCTGIRSGDMMLIEAEKAIRDALTEKFGDKADLGSGSLRDAIKEKLDDPSINWEFVLEETTLSDDFGSVEDLRKLVNSGNLKALQATASVIRQKGFGLINNLETFKAWIAEVIDGNGLSKSGIFFIWDEFTEYVTNSDDHTVMQQISEFCKEKPLFMLYVVHRSQEMLDSLGENRYQMITHRFHQVEFHVSADAAFDLIAGSINTRTGVDQQWKEDRKAVIKRIQRFLPDMSGLDDKISEQIEMLCPMHPMTIRLLSRVAESFAAAQRTMFRFMKDRSDSRLGFVGYINQFGPDDQACWLTPDWLWDYFFTRESDFSDKDTKAAEYIHHYEQNRHLVESDENAMRVFKIAMLLLAVMSSTKGVYGGTRAHGGISATVGCLENCLAGVMSKEQIADLLATLDDCKMILRDESVNGVVRLQLPYIGGGDPFKERYEKNDAKYSRYQLFSKDGVFAQDFEKRAWDENDAANKRMKICVCCAETNSIKNRQEEIQKDLDKNPYKLGLLVVTVRDDAQFFAVQSDLKKRLSDANEPRLTIALVKAPLTDETRKKWLTSLTHFELSTESGKTASAAQYKQEATTTVTTWAASAASGSKIIAWNRDQVFSDLYGMVHLRKTIKTNVLEELFPYAPESVVVTNTAYKTCNDSAPLAGITRTTNNAQLKSVLSSLTASGLLNLSAIDAMVEAAGSKAADSVSALARLIRDEMNSGQRVVLGDLWDKLQRPPFGYYNTIACGVLLGYVFSYYKDSAFSWTDNAQSTHILGESTLKTMVLNMCKGMMTTDYLSAGSVTFQKFRLYAQKICNLTDAQIATETECWHNMREAVTRAGAPFWVMKYLPESSYGSTDHRDAAMKIVDQMQLFIAQEGDKEAIMSTVIQLFNGRGKLRKALENAFQNKNTMSAAFRSFLFESSPELKEIAGKLSVQPEDLSDRLHMVMQNAIYTWTEDQVKEKLPEVVSDYRYLDILNGVLGKTYHSAEDARKDLANLFKFLRIPLSAIENRGVAWYPALRVMRSVALNGTGKLTPEEREADIAILTEHGQSAMDCLRDAKPVLAGILEARGLECSEEELNIVYSALRDTSCDASLSQFDKDLGTQIHFISQARNRVLLKERWRVLSGEETVKSWCNTHGVPLLWVVNKDQQKAIETVIEVQNENRTLDQNVQAAIDTLNTMDNSILTDDQKISAAFLKTVGEEYKAVLETDRVVVMARAKIQLGNDLSTWSITDLAALQKILKTLLREKAKKEKLEQAKKSADSMEVGKLRERVKAFMENHPEFCDDFLA